MALDLLKGFRVHICQELCKLVLARIILHLTTRAYSCERIDHEHRVGASHSQKAMPLPVSLIHFNLAEKGTAGSVEL